MLVVSRFCFLINTFMANLMISLIFQIIQMDNTGLVKRKLVYTTNIFNTFHAIDFSFSMLQQHHEM